MITFEESISSAKDMASRRDWFCGYSEGKKYLDYWQRRIRDFEAYWPNNVYGVAKNIKRYLGIPQNYCLPGVTRHGIHFEMYKHVDLHPNEFPDGDPTVDFRCALSWPHFMDPIYEMNLGKEKVLPTAGPFVYSIDNWKRQREIENVKVKREGTMFFPRHSTYSRTVITDYEKMYRDLESLPDEMKPIRVCVFHADVDLGVAEEAKRRGYEVYCCGSTFDQNFHWRMLDILSTVKYACSQKVTSNAMYATMAGVHYFLLDAKMKYINNDQFPILRMKDGADPKSALEHKKKVTEQFRALDESALPERLKTAQRLLGYERKKSPKQYLTELVEFGERNFTEQGAKKYNILHPSTINISDYHS